MRRQGQESRGMKHPQNPAVASAAVVSYWPVGSVGDPGRIILLFSLPQPQKARGTQGENSVWRNSAGSLAELGAKAATKIFFKNFLS